MTTSGRAGNKRIKEVGVIGAGVMGAGIAAQLANAGLKVTLLDIVPPKFTDADKAADRAMKKDGFGFFGETALLQ